MAAFRFPVRCAFVAAVTGVAIAAVVAPAAAQSLRPAVIANATAAASKSAAFVGILGEVPQPGVYETTGTAPRLIDVVGRAGGLSANASGNIRVIRHGRSGQQMFYSPKFDVALQPGDLLIVDGRGHHGRSHVAANANGGDADVRHAVGSSDDHAPVQLAFLGLLDRPVVLKMRPEHATLERIVALLQQPPDALASIRVVETGPTRVVANAERPEQVTLASGTVLVFDPRTVQSSRLPALPKPNRPLGAELPPPEPSRFLPPSPSSAPPPLAATDPVETPADAPRPKLPQPLPTTIRPDGAVVVLPSLDATPPAPIAPPPPEIPPEPATRFAARPTAVERTTRPSEPPPWKVAATAGDPFAVHRAEPPPLPTAANAVATTEPATSSASRLMPLVRALCGAAIFAAAGGLWWLARHRERFLGSAATTTVAVPANELDALLENRLPIIEEPIVLPTAISFYGRPVGTRRLRLDSAQESAVKPPVSRRHRVSELDGGTLVVPNEVDETVAEDRPVAAPRSVRASEPLERSASVTVDELLDAIDEPLRTERPKSPLRGPHFDATGARRAHGRAAETKKSSEPVERSLEVGLLDRALSSIHGAVRP